MKHMHPTAINYLTYLVLNKRKLHNSQPPVDPPHHNAKQPSPRFTTHMSLICPHGAHIPKGSECACPEGW